MSTVTLKKENVLKAYEDGCEDVKKVLENLHPDLFEPKIKYEDHEIIGFLQEGMVGTILMTSSGSYNVVYLISTSYWDSSSFNDGQKALDYLLSSDGVDQIKGFDSQQDFFKWCVKVTK